MTDRNDFSLWTCNQASVFTEAAQLAARNTHSNRVRPAHPGRPALPAAAVIRWAAVLTIGAGVLSLAGVLV
jgi:hypothetical protein